MSRELFEPIVDALVEDGYIVLKNALSLELTSALIKLSKNQTNYKNAGISDRTALHVDKNKRSDKTVWLDEDGSAISEYLSLMQELREYLNRSLFLGLSYHEAHFALYEKGDFYEKHLDTFKGKKSRIITTVFYLNGKWNKKNGGDLLIYDENNNMIKEVIPNAGTLVVFLSEKFPHEVLVSKAKRYSIAGWFGVAR